MSILDLESFRVLFAQEAEGRLAALGQLALELEAAGNDEGIIAAIFREVHTLKGSAAVVGFGEVSGCAHRLEQRLEALRSGASPVSSELVDALLQALDELSALTAAAVAGEGAEVGLKPLTIPTVSLPAPAAPAVRPPAVSHDAGVVMVPLERLDELIRLVGESAAAHLRVGRLLWERLGLEPAGIPEFSELSRTLNDLQERTMRTRMVPVATMT
ncbi:MAG: two-component system, chemotaxis family, sensor kinase CheA, partial [Actinomycetota bacterium]|nr:two-component system, chemotaxis family, sensor kinase CheA [Actinomycetota bacterium]